jgi:hypothetical protein
MPRYLIEIAHDDEHAACVQALRTIEQYGSHFLTQADWGCKAGEHCGWMIVELDSRNEAVQMVPPEYRREARIFELNRFTKEQIASLITELEG